jgi:hypothetical protein
MMIARQGKSRVDMSGYVSDRVFSGKRQLTADQAKAHRMRALAVLQKRVDEDIAAADAERRKRA